MPDARKYAGKRFSILGDSISTLKGYNPPGYALFYTGATCKVTGVRTPADTWWGMVVERLGGELLVNDSWSGCRVTRLPDLLGDFPSGCSDGRTSKLHKDGVMPDVIIVYLGTNDWGYGACLRAPADCPKILENDYFDVAYRLMIGKLRGNYPDALICCCTLCETYLPADYNFVFPSSLGGTHIQDYNDVIREICADPSLSPAGAVPLKLIDLFSYYTPYATVDGFHPTARGMETLADLVVKALTEG